MNAQQLKNSILQLAVQGKLVPQDPNDEPASKLVERIRAEKEKLIKEKKVKPDKNPSYIFRGSDNLPYEKVGDSEPVCIAEAVPFEIPDSWEWVRLGSLSNINGGYAFKSTNYTTEGIRVIRISDFNENGFVNKSIVRHKFDDSLSEYLIQEKNIILCMTGGTVGKSYFVSQIPEPMVTNQRVATIKMLVVNEDYINLVVLSPITQKIISDSKNSTNDNISMDTIKNFFIPLPPQAEQERIVNKIKKLEPYIKDYDIAYEKIEKLNNNFPEQLKKSILQEAVQGKLVPQNPKDEPASVLIERIRGKKQKLIQEKKIKKDKNESYIFRRDNSHYEKIGNEERCIDDEVPFDIPDSWEWVRLVNICTKIVDGDHNPPKGEINKTNYIMASSTNINNGTIVDIEKVRYLSKEIFEKENQRTDAQVGDIFFTSVGSIGRSCIYLGGYNICFQRSVSVLKTLIYNYYLKYYFDSPYFQQKIIKDATGTAQKGFYLNQLSKSLIPVPPLEEQKRIVEKIQTLMPIIEIL